MTTTSYVGNANDDADTNRGWLLGHFMGDETRNTDAVEIKWGLHPAGQRRDGWTDGEQRTTLLLLVSADSGSTCPTAASPFNGKAITSSGAKAPITPGKPRTTPP